MNTPTQSCAVQWDLFPKCDEGLRSSTLRTVQSDVELVVSSPHQAPWAPALPSALWDPTCGDPGGSDRSGSISFVWNGTSAPSGFIFKRAELSFDNMQQDCYHPRRRTHGPFWTPFITVPFFTMPLSLANLQLWRELDIVVTVVISCISYIVKKAAIYFTFNGRVGDRHFCSRPFSKYLFVHVCVHCYGGGSTRLGPCA